jgi:hypothetical protein
MSEPSQWAFAVLTVAMRVLLGIFGASRAHPARSDPTDAWEVGGRPYERMVP